MENLVRPHWRWLGYSCESGQDSMDKDQMLFDAVKRGESLPALRFFRWANPALSYGRTQGIDLQSRTDALAQGLEVVRRPTGGGKVPHGTDLCFSLHWRKEDPAIPWTISDSYLVIHRWIQQSLEELGHPTEILPRKCEDETGWCFQSAVCYDLVRNGSKVVGGAQWRDAKAALHQGSIQLALPDASVEVFRRRFESAFGIAFAETLPC